MSFGVHIQPATIEKGQLKERVIVFSLDSNLRRYTDRKGGDYATTGQDPRAYIAQVRGKGGRVLSRPGLEVHYEHRLVGGKIDPLAGTFTFMPTRKFPQDNIASELNAKPGNKEDLEAAVRTVLENLDLKWNRNMDDVA